LHGLVGVATHRRQEKSDWRERKERLKKIPCHFGEGSYKTVLLVPTHKPLLCRKYVVWLNFASFTTGHTFPNVPLSSQKNQRVTTRTRPLINLGRQICLLLVTATSIRPLSTNSY
jgi:hypothetical protein